jgi:hypothetical protein
MCIYTYTEHVYALCRCMCMDTYVCMYMYEDIGPKWRSCISASKEYMDIYACIHVCVCMHIIIACHDSHHTRASYTHTHAHTHDTTRAS